MDLAVVLSGEALGQNNEVRISISIEIRISSEILASTTRSEALLLRNEDRVKGAGTSGQGPETPAWRRVTPTERISRTGGVWPALGPGAG